MKWISGSSQLSWATYQPGFSWIFVVNTLTMIPSVIWFVLRNDSATLFYDGLFLCSLLTQTYAYFKTHAYRGHRLRSLLPPLQSGSERAHDRLLSENRKFTSLLPASCTSLPAGMFFSQTLRFFFLFRSGKIQQRLTRPTILPTDAVVEASNEFFSRCKTCKVLRPQRSHHCSTCDSCIDRLDHHCIWVANCIGYGNLHSFHQYLLYTVISCCMAFWQEFHYLLHARGRPLHAQELVCLALSMPITITTMCAVGYLLLLEMELVYRGVTMFETMSKLRNTIKPTHTGSALSIIRSILKYPKKYEQMTGSSLVYFIIPQFLLLKVNGKYLARSPEFVHFQGVLNTLQTKAVKGDATKESDYL